MYTMPNLIYLEKSGFTLVELLITISIMAILSATVFPGFAGFADNQQVQQQTLNVVSDAEIAKNKALAGAYSTGSPPESASWGITFCTGTSNTYTLSGFKPDGSALSSPGTADVKLVTLQGGVIFDCLPASPVIWRFDRLTGRPVANGGSVKISKGSRTRTITLNASGSIEIQ